MKLSNISKHYKYLIHSLLWPKILSQKETRESERQKERKLTSCKIKIVLNTTRFVS